MPSWYWTNTDWGPHLDLPLRYPNMLIKQCSIARCYAVSTQCADYKPKHHFSKLLQLSLNHWGRVRHICVTKVTTIGLDNGLSSGQRQAIIWTHDGILLTGPLGTNLSETLTQIYTFPFKKMHLKMSSGRWWPFCPSLNVLILNVFTDQAISFKVSLYYSCEN